MKMLSVANVGTIIGGTGACALSCIKALPDWSHVVFFFGHGEASEQVRKAFEGCTIAVGTSIQRSLLEGVDVVLFHNTHSVKVPVSFPDECLTVYMQHSAFKGAVEGRSRCDVTLAVSKWLAKQADIDERFVLHQPVPRPPRPEEERNRHDGRFVVGRLCTPSPQKWKRDEVIPFYTELANRNYSVEWEFVGCPRGLRDELNSAVGGATFHEASPSARSLLWNWNAMLYHAGLQESYGRTVCEAQRCGCVPIVDAQGGFAEQIKDGDDGFLCSGVMGFTDAINDCRNEYSEMSAAAAVSGDIRGSLHNWRSSFLRWCHASMRAMA